MSTINNEAEFNQALNNLNVEQQRAVAANFVTSVLPLTTDNRVQQVLQVSDNQDASAAELESARQTVRAAVIDGHTRCGAECDWNDQAAYFVIRAAQSALEENAAWQAAMSSRMARNSAMIANEDNATNPEISKQYNILNNYLSD